MRKGPSTHLVRNSLLGSIPFLLLIIIWHVFQQTNQNLGWLIPSPLETAVSFWRLISDGTLLELVGISLLNLLPPFAVGAILAVGLGVIMGVNRMAYKIFFPLLTAMYPVPSLAWLPFLIIFFGFTQEALWAVILISTFTKMIYNVIGGVQSINVEYIFAAKNFGFSKTKIIWDVILPSSLPQIITGLRIGFGSAWRSLIGAEMLVVTLGGLGKFIWTSQWYFKFDQVVAGVIVISLISILIETVVFRKLEKATLVKWGLIQNEQYG